MHRDIDFSIEGISKIEGHASLDVKIRSGKVEDVKLRVSEDKRFYTQAVRGKNALNVPMITSRICGTCSFAHLLCAVHAVEDAFEVQPSEQTMILRKLASYGSIIRDHSMHLYMFCLPDIFEKDSILDFDSTEEHWVKECFKVKGVGNELATLMGGRAVHPTNLLVGGVQNVPAKENIKKTVEDLKGIKEDVLKLIEVFHSRPFVFNQDTRYVCSKNDDYSYTGSGIIDSEGAVIEKKDFMDHFFRVVIPYSEAVGYELEGRDYVVGALARMNLNSKNLKKETKESASEFIKVFPSNNIFHNNLAQAIEVLNAIHSSIEILESNEFKEEKISVEVKKGEGIGVVEAPRGLLYYHLNIDSTGKITDANLVIPTSQNQVRMQMDVKRVIEDNIDKEKDVIVKEVEKLVRAYDPCMSCATHFLHVNWK
jgi:coenzyme F420-reducing hydrogenase alpha subunit